MGVARRKGDCGKADRLFSQIIRSQGYCERCGVTDVPLDTAHLVGRRFSATRCMEENARALCRSCHYLIDTNAAEKVSLAGGLEEYDRLWRIANEPRKFGPVFWRDEVERLQARWNEIQEAA